MKNIKAVITVVSWEERFVKGFKINVVKHKPDYVIVFRYKSYEENYRANLDSVKEVCNELGIAFQEEKLDFLDPKQNWITIRKSINNFIDNGSDVLLDITTMPRETIWSTLFFLEQAKAKVEYVYHRPASHNNDWLSRDPSSPRLLYKMSGICELGKPTLLFVLPGHDYQRVSNLINSFEPGKLIIASQCDDDPKNQEVVNKCIKENKGNMIIEKIEIEPFENNHGFEIISKKVEENFRNYNIVFSSLGPKITAITLYRINRAYPETALCYIPCKEFNVNYSKGFLEGESISGHLVVPKRKHQLVMDY